MNRDDAAAAVAEATGEHLQTVGDERWSEDRHQEQALDCINVAVKELNSKGHADPEEQPELWAHVIAMATAQMMTSRQVWGIITEEDQS